MSEPTTVAGKGLLERLVGLGRDYYGVAQDIAAVEQQARADSVGAVVSRTDAEPRPFDDAQRDELAEPVSAAAEAKLRAALDRLLVKSGYLTGCEQMNARLLATLDAERAARTPAPSDVWAAWITRQTRRTDWACRECVDADVSGQDRLVVPGFRCVWHEAFARQLVALTPASPSPRVHALRDQIDADPERRARVDAIKDEMLRHTHHPEDPCDCEPGETAWLIERGQPEGHVPPVWRLPDVDGDTSARSGDWTTNAWDAQRFASRAEAEAFIEAHSPIPGNRDRIGRAVEHGFAR